MNITFESILDQFEKDRLPSKDYLNHLRFVVNLFNRETGIEYFNETTKITLNNWKYNLLRRTSEQTCNNYLRHLKALYSFAYDEELINENPFAKFRMVRVHEKKYRSISSSDIDVVIEYLSTSENTLQPGWFWIIVIKTLYYTAIRRRQIVSLKWQNIDFENCKINLSSESSKNKKFWDIPLPDSIYKDLVMLKEKQISIYGNINIDTHQVFNVTLFNHRYKGNEMQRSQLSGFFRNLSEKLSIKVSSHRFRHRTSTNLVNQHTNIKEVQEFLGHSDIKTTLTYVETDMDNIRESLTLIRPI